MSAFETIKAAYAAFARNDPSVLFAAMDPGINWNQAEGNLLADRGIMKNGGPPLDPPSATCTGFTAAR